MKSWKQKEACDEKEDKKAGAYLSNWALAIDYVSLVPTRPFLPRIWSLKNNFHFSFRKERNFDRELQDQDSKMANYGKILKPRQTFTFIGQRCIVLYEGVLAAQK